MAIENQSIVRDCYEYMEAFSRTIYENEERREASLTQQAANMQTAFSFVIAALFMVATIVIDNRGQLSLNFLFWAFSSVTFVLAFCLFAATMAQNRTKRDDFPSVSTIKRKIIEEFNNFETPEQRSKYLVDTYELMHKSYSAINDKKQKWVTYSMNAFYLALVLCLIWYVIALFIIF